MVDNMVNEIWKEIDGFNGDFSVSNLGRVRSNIDKYCCNGRHLYRGKILSPSRISAKSRYYRLGLTDYLTGNRKSYNVHRLVAEAFIPNPLSLPVVNHKSGERSDNSVDNLEWVTHQENVHHAFKTGLSNAPTGEFREDVVYDKDCILGVLNDFYYNFLLCDEIEAKYNLPQNYAPLVVRGKRWVGVYAEFINGREEYCDTILKIFSKRRASNRERIEQEARNAAEKLAQ